MILWGRTQTDLATGLYFKFMGRLEKDESPQSPQPTPMDTAYDVNFAKRPLTIFVCALIIVTYNKRYSKLRSP